MNDLGSSLLKRLFYESPGEVPPAVLAEIAKLNNLKTLCLFGSKEIDIRGWGQVCTDIPHRLTTLYIDVVPDYKSFRRRIVDVFDRLYHLQKLEVHCRRIDQ